MQNGTVVRPIQVLSWVKKSRIRKLLALMITAITLWNVSLWMVGQWYAYRHRDEPLSYGVTFVADYARQLGLDPQETFRHITSELPIKRMRLVSYWKIHEPTKGQYDWSELDWQMDMAAAKGIKVSLSIGLRQPRWPECHGPQWAMDEPYQQWRLDLEDYITATVQRYSTYSNLDSYQLENEFLMTVFGNCPDHSRDRLVSEYQLIKKLDPTRPLIVSRSNNWVGVAIGQPRPDIGGISVYKRIWVPYLGGHYWEYPLPSWFYSGIAGWTELLTGRNIIIHELQAEPWPPGGKFVTDVSIAEQDKSMDASRLADRIAYAKDSGIKTIDLWGAEWWYWRRAQGDNSLWNQAKATLR
jgi:hypothetical protein